MQSRLCCTAVVFAILVSITGVRAAAPPGGVDDARVKVLLHRLDAESFHTRQKADDTLRAMGKPVLPLLREELGRTASLEVRSRLERMVNDLTIDERIGDLVEMLGHQNSQFGDQAEYALRQAGAGVVPLLKQALKPTLDGKRRKRIEKIIAELSVDGR
jgi:hypothetical protein